MKRQSHSWVVAVKQAAVPHIHGRATTHAKKVVATSNHLAAQHPLKRLQQVRLPPRPQATKLIEVPHVGGNTPKPPSRTRRYGRHSPPSKPLSTHLHTSRARVTVLRYRSARIFVSNTAFSSTVAPR